MSEVKTYILAPKFIFEYGPGHEPWLGNIIANPKDPLTVCDKASSSPGTVKKMDVYDWSLSRTGSASTTGSLSTTLLQVLSQSIGAEKATEWITKYTASSVEIHYLQLDTEEVTQRARTSPGVQEAMLDPVLGTKPVYIISGLMTAKGFTYSSTQRLSQDGHVSGVGRASTATQVTSYRVPGEHEIILAYELHKIAEEGWLARRRKLSVSRFEPSYAVLGDSEVSNDSGFEMWRASANDLQDEESVAVVTRTDGTINNTEAVNLVQLK